MAKATREYVYGINPAFEVLRAQRRKVYGAWLNQSARCLLYTSDAADE